MKFENIKFKNVNHIRDNNYSNFTKFNNYISVWS